MKDELIVCLKGERESWEVDAESLGYDIEVVTPGINPETMFLCRRYETVIISQGVASLADLLASVKRCVFRVAEVVKIEREDGLYLEADDKACEECQYHCRDFGKETNGGKLPTPKHSPTCSKNPNGVFNAFK